ncbi:PEP-CTERM sorting domain-containing protein [Massilia sp. S19_KUP03_FR1]|uniref:PEP-CTERM sorting domain-containing protein n=1 Tax=Massilia sp. S19_KUP03_FR1 TaxID=3025503 RepID=UPI002FCDA537
MNNTLRSLLLKSALVLSASAALCASATAGVLTTKVSVDNGFSAYLSTTNNTLGTTFSSANDWYTVTRGSVTLGTLAQYYLHIAAYDQGGVAGMLGAFSLADSGYHFANGTTSLLTGSNLITANTTGFTGAYTATTSYGANGVAPWGSLAGISSSAQWIWSGNNDFNDRSYFTIAILKDAPSNVPEPGSLGLLGLGLLALTRVAKKPGKAK